MAVFIAKLQSCTYLIWLRNTVFMLLAFPRTPIRPPNAMRVDILEVGQTSELTYIHGEHRNGFFHDAGMSLLIPPFNGGRDRRFCFCTAFAFAFASGSASAHESNIQLNQVTQAISAVAIRLGMRHLMQHPISGNPADHNLPGLPKGRQASSVEDHKIYGQKPMYRGQYGRVKEYARCYGGLEMGVRAIIDRARSLARVLDRTHTCGIEDHWVTSAELLQRIKASTQAVTTAYENVLPASAANSCLLL